MPAMPRIKGKATKVAHNVLGIPANIRDKKTPKQKELSERLVEQETIRVR